MFVHMPYISIIQVIRNRAASRRVSLNMDQKSIRPSFCLESGQSDLRQTVDPLLAHPRRSGFCGMCISRSGEPKSPPLHECNNRRPLPQFSANNWSSRIPTMRAGTLLKSQIPIRTFQHWNETQPGFLEAERARSLRHRGQGRLCVYIDPHRHLDGMDRVPPSSVSLLLTSQLGEDSCGYPTRTHALSFPDLGHRYR